VVVFPVDGGSQVHLVGGGMVREHLGVSRGVRHGLKYKGDDGVADVTKEGGKWWRWLQRPGWTRSRGSSCGEGKSEKMARRWLTPFRGGSGGVEQ
jgi:hypothetical protein